MPAGLSAYFSRARVGEVLVRAVLHRAPESQAVFDREHGKRDIFDQFERRRVALLASGIDSSATEIKLTMMSATSSRSTAG